MPFKLTARKIRRALLVAGFALALLFQFGVNQTPSTGTQTHAAANTQIVADGGDNGCTSPSCGH